MSKKNNNINEREGQGQDTTICEKCQKNQALPGGKLCQGCQERQEVIKDCTYNEALHNILDQTLYGVQSFVNILDDGFDDGRVAEAVLVLKPLFKRLEADLDKIGQVCYDTLGLIQIKVCRCHLDLDGKIYNKGDFLEATLGPRPVLTGRVKEAYERLMGKTSKTADD